MDRGFVLLICRVRAIVLGFSRWEGTRSTCAWTDAVVRQYLWIGVLSSLFAVYEPSYWAS
jgi:hypothetical protein